MNPEEASMIRNRARASEDFPAPVLPTIPTFSPDLMEQVKFFKTSGSPFLYLVWYSWKVNLPSWGHCAEGLYLPLVQWAWEN